MSTFFRDIRFVVYATIALIFTSCITDDDEFVIDPNKPTRTMLVYLGLDNSLSQTLQSELEALRAGWTYTGNRCLIYVDPADDVPMLLSLRGGCKSHPVPYIDTLEVYQEDNSASAQTFSRVISDVVTLYPADSYGLIFTSHASGWLPSGALADPTLNGRSVGMDMNTGTLATDSEMELADFANAIPDGQFDFIIFEACLMGGVEVAYELRNKCDFILASSAELLVPGFAPVYQEHLRDLFDTDTTVQRSLEKFSNSYFNYILGLNGARSSTTLSIIKTDEINALATLSKDVLSQSFQFSSDTITLQHFDRPGSYGDYPAVPRYFDFLEYMQRVASPTQYTLIEALVDRVVVWKAATPEFMKDYNGFDVSRHSGLTIYIENSSLRFLNEAYKETNWWIITH